MHAAVVLAAAEIISVNLPLRFRSHNASEYEEDFEHIVLDVADTFSL